MEEFKKNWRKLIFKCPICHWNGPGSRVTNGVVCYEVMEVHCPECDKKIALVLIEEVINYRKQLKEKTCNLTVYKDINIDFSVGLKLSLEEMIYDEFYQLTDFLKDPIWEEYYQDMNWDNYEDTHQPIKWHIKGTDFSNLTNIVKQGRYTIWKSPTYLGNWKTFIKFIEEIGDSSLEVRLTELAYSIMTGKDPKAHNKIDIAMARLGIRIY